MCESLTAVSVQEPNSGPPTLVTLKVDPDGFFLYWTGGSNLVRRASAHTHTHTIRE